MKDNYLQIQLDYFKAHQNDKKREGFPIGKPS